MKNEYVCFWKNKKFEVHADSSYAAQCKVAKMIWLAKKVRAKKQCEITVVLAKKDGVQVTHAPCF